MTFFTCLKRRIGDSPSDPPGDPPGNLPGDSPGDRAGSGHFFHGAGWVSGLWFWLGSGSGYKKFPRVHFGL